jgi:hypothetical protein
MIGRLKFIDAHPALFLLKNSLSIPKLTYLLSTGTCFLLPNKLERYDQTLTDGIALITNVELDERARQQSCLPVKLGGLGIPSTTLLATSCFLSSASSCGVLVSNIAPAGGTSEVAGRATYIWMLLSGSEPPRDPAYQKNWTKPVYQKMLQDLLEALPNAALGLKLSDLQLRVSVALRLGAKICEAHTCICGDAVATDGLHGLSCKKSAGRHSRHSQLNDLFKRSLASINVPSVLEPPGLSTTDGKRPDGLTTVPWSRGCPLTWDVTVVDALCRSRTLEGSRRCGKSKDREIRIYNDTGIPFSATGF